MGFRAKKVGKNTEKYVRRAAIAADEGVVLGTPVDTGRARANWVVSISAPDYDVEDFDGGGEAAANKALAQGRGTVSLWRLGLGPIFITNSVPYIVPLDEGSSAQAPSGMTDQAIAAARAELKKAKLL